MDNEAIFGAEFDLSSEDESTDKDQRTFQSEEDFQRQKQSWTPKIENRQVPSLPPGLSSSLGQLILLGITTVRGYRT